MNATQTNRTRAFTLIEMLMVIAIIAIVAGLVVGLAAVASPTKKINRAKTELQKLVTLIENYKSKVGVYPPDHPSNDDVNSLLYELAGAIRTNTPINDPIYGTVFGSIQSNELWSTYGLTGIVNASDENGNPEDWQVKHFLKDLSPDQFATVAGHLSLVVPVDGLNGKPNPWHYLRFDPNDPNNLKRAKMHNPETFDLWVEIVIGHTNNGAGVSVPKTQTIGNWKN